MSYIYKSIIFITSSFNILLTLVNVIYIESYKQDNKIALLVFNIFCAALNIISIGTLCMKLYLLRFETFSAIPLLISLYTIFTFFIDYSLIFGNYYLTVLNSFALLYSFVMFIIAKDNYLLDQLTSSERNIYI